MTLHKNHLLLDEQKYIGSIKATVGKCYCKKFIHDDIDEFNFNYFLEENNPHKEIISDALYHAEDDYSNGFNTGEDFGCIHHEEQ